LSGHAPDEAAVAFQRRQLWLWAVGMMIMTLPWHWLGLHGQWRRVAHFDYSDPLIAWWGPWVVVSLVGGIVLLASAALFIWNLASLHFREARQGAAPAPFGYALALHPPGRIPAALNGFVLWNVLVLILMAAAYGWPIAQFIVKPSPGAIVHHLDRAG
jgi:cytochrome c oxidase subunit I